MEPDFSVYIQDEMWLHILLKYGEEILIKKHLIESSA